MFEITDHLSISKKLNEKLPTDQRIAEQWSSKFTEEGFIDAMLRKYKYHNAIIQWDNIKTQNRIVESYTIINYIIPYLDKSHILIYNLGDPFNYHVSAAASGKLNFCLTVHSDINPLPDAIKNEAVFKAKQIKEEIELRLNLINEHVNELNKKLLQKIISIANTKQQVILQKREFENL